MDSRRKTVPSKNMKKTSKTSKLLKKLRRKEDITLRKSNGGQQNVSIAQQ